MRLQRLALLLFWLFCTLPAVAGGFAFKGIELGSGIAALASQPKYVCRSVHAPGADTICALRPGEKETIAGAPLRSLFFFYYDGRLTGISMHVEESRFAGIVEALRGRYGEAALTRETLRNLKGVAFENHIHTWKTATQTLLAQRYSGRLDQSLIRFTDDAAMRRIEAGRAAAARDPRQDL